MVLDLDVSLIPFVFRDDSLVPRLVKLEEAIEISHVKLAAIIQ